ncbi:carbonic anhydrase family protein [Vibrio sp. PP-XX7]
MNKLYVAMSVSAVLSLSAGVQASNDGSRWGYQSVYGPESWGHVSKTCETGKNQSPINIKDTLQADLKPLVFKYEGEVTALQNNGHTLQATVTGDNVLVVDGQEFTLKQFHFHTPSENLINDHQYPLEAHFVHANRAGELAVVSVMYDAGTANAELAQLAKELPQSGHTVKLEQPFPVQSMLPSTQSYYRFNGSLTTPPCSEGVRWLVLKQPQTLSAEQATELMTMMGHNNRPLQEKNSRTILSQ